MNGFDPAVWLRHPWEAGPRVDAGVDVAKGDFSSVTVQGLCLGELQRTPLDCVDDVMAASFRGWISGSKSDFILRNQQIQSGLQLLRERKEALAQVVSQEEGVDAGRVVQELEQSVVWLGDHLSRSESLLDKPLELPGPTGESNRLRWCGRGTWLLLADQSMPLAMVLQSICLALFCGNSLVVKSAPSTSFSLARVVESLYEGGVSSAVLQLLPGGNALEMSLLSHRGLSGVLCCGRSRSIALMRTLSDREGALTPLVVMPGTVDDPRWASLQLLYRLMCEQTLTWNLTAAGGNVGLLSATSK